MRFRLRFLVVLFTIPLFAQKPKPGQLIRERTIDFIDAKVVLGLPADVSKRPSLCSPDGLTFFEDSQDGSLPRDLYSVSATAEVKHLQRKLPVDFTNVVLKDFYPSEHTLVSLLEASNRDQPGSQPRGQEYFLSTSDQSGDRSDLLTLALRFKPVKVGAFGSGDFLVLGWDVANELPLLARLKADGTVRVFVDTTELQKAGGAASSLAELSKAAFIPRGDNILLTFPGTTDPIWVMSDKGTNSTLALVFPAGFVLRDVLGSDGRYSSTLYRVQAESDGDEARNAKTPVPPRVLELNYPITEFKLVKAPPTSVTCGAKQSLTAIWMRAKGTPVKETDGEQKPAADEARELVVGSVRR